MLDHDAWKPAQNDLDPAEEVDATAWAVDVADPDGDALDAARILPELFAESASDVRPVIVIEPDTVYSDVRGRQRCGRSTCRPLHGPGHVTRERCSPSNVLCADAFA